MNSVLKHVDIYPIFSEDLSLLINERESNFDDLEWIGNKIVTYFE